MKPRTQRNLVTALQGEALAYVKYTLFAGQARRNGHPELAELFEKTAHVERFEHLSEEAELAGLVGSDAENLGNAIQGESYEVETMYREFAAQASDDGDLAAARRFAEIRGDEMGHRDAFKAALVQLDQVSER